MIEYRKHKSSRLFYRIENETVTKVINREKSALIEVVDNWIVVSNATDYDTVKCTEQEFNTAYQEALQRIKDMKI